MDGLRDKDDVNGMTRRRMLRRIGCVSAAIAGTATAHPSPLAGDRRTIAGTLEGVRFLEGCGGGSVFCMNGTFQGDHGFRGVFTMGIRGFQTVSIDPFGRLAAAMTWTFQSTDGEIGNDDLAGIDFTAGKFASVGNLAGYTGNLEGATGDAFVYGHISTDEPLERFTGKFVFELLLPKKNG